jgi:hypothetical protein
VEVKSSERELRDLSGLEAFHEDQPRVPLLAVAPIERPRRIGPIEVVPWTDFLARLPGLVGA